MTRMIPVTKRHPLVHLALCLLFSLAFNFVGRAQTRSTRARQSSRVNKAQQPPSSDSQRLAQTVTIYRDTYGVPHVFGRTDASTVFGFAYAQAEDNFWRVEENFIWAWGRASELYGEESLNEDLLNHALQIPRLAQEDYGRLDPHMRTQ